VKLSVLWVKLAPSQAMTQEHSFELHGKDFINFEQAMIAQSKTLDLSDTAK
jgi:hypothetical protein